MKRSIDSRSIRPDLRVTARKWNSRHSHFSQDPRVPIYDKDPLWRHVEREPRSAPSWKSGPSRAALSRRKNKGFSPRGRGYALRSHNSIFRIVTKLETLRL